MPTEKLFAASQPPEALRAILLQNADVVTDIQGILNRLDPAQSDMASATLSPVGVVHLFRQYFFEFATFLGSPVQHVWLSPGGTVELLEISTRQVTVERTFTNWPDPALAARYAGLTPAALTIMIGRHRDFEMTYNGRRAAISIK